MLNNVLKITDKYWKGAQYYMSLYYFYFLSLGGVYVKERQFSLNLDQTRLIPFE